VSAMEPEHHGGRSLLKSNRKGEMNERKGRTAIFSCGCPARLFISVSISGVWVSYLDPPYIPLQP
jgi:hypothetical protein